MLSVVFVSAKGKHQKQFFPTNRIYLDQLFGFRLISQNSQEQFPRTPLVFRLCYCISQLMAGISIPNVQRSSTRSPLHDGRDWKVLSPDAPQ